MKVEIIDDAKKANLGNANKPINLKKKYSTSTNLQPVPPHNSDFWFKYYGYFK